MCSIKELLESDIPYLKLDDMTDDDWIQLDFALEEFDRTNQPYSPDGCIVLEFVLQQIHFDKANFIKVPHFIRNSPQFKELAVKYNPSLVSTLFPNRT